MNRRQPGLRSSWAISNLAPRGTNILLQCALLLTMAVIPKTSFAQHESAAAKCPPATRVDDVVEDLHGVQVADPYRWLEDQTSPETRAWIDAQDRCTHALLDSLPGRAAIMKRVTELSKVDVYGIPMERNGTYFYARRNADQELFVIYERHGIDGAEEVLIDPHPMSADHSTSVSLLDVSKDAKLAAYRIRTGGQDEVTVHFINTETRKDLPDQLPHGNYFGLAIEPDKRGVYYSVMTAEGPRVFHHVMGTAASSDEEIFGKGYGRDKIIVVQLSEDGRDLLIGLIYGSGSTRSELYYKDLERNGPVAPIVNDLNSLFFGEIQDGIAYVQTNWNAPKWHIYRVDLKHTARDAWKEIVPESDATIESSRPIGGRIVVQYLRNVISQIKIFDTDGKAGGEIPLPSLGAAAGVSGNWETPDVFFQFASFNIPTSIYRYNLKTTKMETWSTLKVPVDSNAYAVEQVWYESKDKTRIPMFLFYKKGLKRDGARPTLLTGYGGFDVNLSPSFDVTAVAWADAGGVFAQPNLRGGGEFGEAWHHAGMMEKKQTVFDDFIAAAEWLEANGYTNPKKLAIAGGSNGGLLVGAALTQRPDLFQAVVCAYPLLDMLRYQKFLDGQFWIPEYGSADDAVQFKYLYAYSPYQNVKKGTLYPAVLFVTGDGDTRVAPLHARKMAARLQAATAWDRPILLLYDTKSGHSGGRPLNKQIEEGTDILSFLYSQLGVTP
ncbi:MAG: prolyl oligopeptidase family serine peptidase [Candidatus Acidiferrales bacterium]